MEKVEKTIRQTIPSADRLDSLEHLYYNQEKSFAVVDLKIASISEQMDKFDKKLDNLLKILDNKDRHYNKLYAPRYAWTILVWAGGIVGTGLIAAVLKLIFA